MDNKDRFIGLSLDIATANRKLLAATEDERGDCFDDIDEGFSTEPARLSIFPEGAYVLTACTEKLGGEKMSGKS
jgi:hypothetical protein